jgi:hypothetical protein
MGYLRDVALDADKWIRVAVASQELIRDSAGGFPKAWRTMNSLRRLAQTECLRSGS